MYVIQKASKPYFKYIGNEKLRGFLTELFGCDLCLGVWVFSIGALLTNMNMVYEICTIPVVSQVITGIITSFLVWVFRNGWDSLFREIVLN